VTRSRESSSRLTTKTRRLMKGQSEKDPVSMENRNNSNASVWSCVHHQRNRVSRIHGKAVLWIISSLSKALPTMVGLNVEGATGSGI
jgi:hypothetical protein